MGTYCILYARTYVREDTRYIVQYNYCRAYSDIRRKLTECSVPHISGWITNAMSENKIEGSSTQSDKTGIPL